MSRNAKTSGFTLVEMLVALAVVAAIVSMVYGSYAATARSMSVCEEGMATSARAQSVLRLMTAQLRCAYLPYDPNANETATADIQSRAASGLFRGDVDDADGDVLSFVTTSRTGGLQVSDRLCLIAYRHVRSTGTLSFVRRNSPRAQHTAEANNELRVLDNVTELQLSFHDGRRWHARWDAAERHALPRAVKIALLIADPNGRRRRYETAVAVMCQAARQGERSGQTRKTRR
jgi:type II secretion system protein J